MGDFNSVWGQSSKHLAIQDLAANLGLSRALNNSPYYTRLVNGTYFDGIDHMLFRPTNDLQLTDFSIDDSLLATISDHLPIIGHFTIPVLSTAPCVIQRPDTAKLVSSLKSSAYLDIDRSNPEILSQFQSTFLNLSATVLDQALSETVSPDLLLETLSYNSAKQFA
jgi:hypothetical protein